MADRARVARYKDPRTGRFAVRPGAVARPRNRSDELLIADQRSVLARRVRRHADVLRSELRRLGVDITATIDLRVLSVARLMTRLEIVQAEMARGGPVDDIDLTRLTNAMTRGLGQLGLSANALAPPAPPKPVRPLSTLVEGTP
jgi:hypothetical protein